MIIKDLAYNSKLRSSEVLGLKTKKYIENDSIILYLGASSGTTVNYIASSFNNAKIFAIDLAPFMLKQIVIESQKEKLKNTIPILADANQPKSYKDMIFSAVDLVYQDVAQKNQLEIFEKNCDLFLKKNGIGMLAIKARSIDTSKMPEKVFKEVENKLKEKYNVLEKFNLQRFQKDHMFFVVQKKSAY